jgi:hypothetical protein
MPSGVDHRAVKERLVSAEATVASTLFTKRMVA